MEKGTLYAGIKRTEVVLLSYKEEFLVQFLFFFLSSLVPRHFEELK